MSSPEATVKAQPPSPPSPVNTPGSEQAAQPSATHSRSHLGQALNFLLPRWLPFRGSVSSDPAPFTTSPDTPLIEDAVEASSLTCAAARAAEDSLAPSERLFHDPLARTLAGPRAPTRRPGAGDEAGIAKGTSARIAIRTRFFDDFVENACAGEVGAKQLVILGAGMDARAYRLDALRGVTVYELDVANVLRLKESLLASVAECEFAQLKAEKIVRVEANVGKTGWDACLVEAGFNWRHRTAWVIEGLVYYLEEERVESLLRTLRVLSREGSTACMSIVGQISEGRKPITDERQVKADVDDGRGKSGVVEGSTGLVVNKDAGPDTVSDAPKRSRPKFVFACPRPREFLTRLGFVVDDLAYLGGETANYGRWPANTEPASNTMYVTFRAPVEAP